MKYLLKDYNLLKSFIQSEFFLQQISSNDRYAATTYHYSKMSLSINDPVLNLKEIKQFIRLLQFTKLTKRPFLQLTVKNPQFDFLIYEFLKKNFKTLCTVENVLDVNIKKTESFSKLIFLVDCFLNSNANFFNKSKYSVFNLIVKVNGISENCGSKNYKINSDIDSLKKLIFLLIIIKHIFIKKKIYANKVKI